MILPQTTLIVPQVMRKDKSEIPGAWAKRHRGHDNNLLTEHYIEQPVTHVRIIMNDVDAVFLLTL